MQHAALTKHATTFSELHEVLAQTVVIATLNFCSFSIFFSKGQNISF